MKPQLVCHAVRRSMIVLLGAAAAVMVVALAATPVSAHPFGEPQSVRLSADGSVVTVRWSAPPDDLVLIGGITGTLPERREIVFETGPTGAPEPVGATDAELLSRSPEVAAYLEDHVEVRQNGTLCPAQVRLDELVEAGAELTFECPEAVEQVEIGVSVLTDVHEAYRTVALGDETTSPERALYTIDDDIHTWNFGVEPQGGPSTAAVVAWAATGLAVSGCVVLALRIWTHRAQRTRASQGTRATRATRRS